MYVQVVSLPPNKPSVRTDHEMQAFITADKANVYRDQLVYAAAAYGLPLLIGTDTTVLSIEVYQHVNKLLDRYVAEASITERPTVRLLNSDPTKAVQESMLVAQAGMSQHITVATNMAGRGTDILLGGDPAQLLLLTLAEPYNAAMLAACDAYDVKTDTVKAGRRTSFGAAEVQVSCCKLCAAPWRRAFS